MKIELYSFDGSGLIFPMKTGVIWSNQCGGTCCLHPEMEGIFLPLHHSLDAGVWWVDHYDIPYEEYCKGMDLLEEENIYFERVSEEEFKDILGPNYCSEAWIPVKIKNGEYIHSHLEPFVGQIGIFTYANSD